MCRRSYLASLPVRLAFQYQSHLLAHQGVKHWGYPSIDELVADDAFHRLTNHQPESTEILDQNLTAHIVVRQKVLVRHQSQLC